MKELEGFAVDDVGKEAIVAAGAVAPLVGLLTSGAPCTREVAAATLRNLATNNAANKEAISAEGGISPLVALLKSGTEGAREQAAAALRRHQHAPHVPSRACAWERQVWHQMRRGGANLGGGKVPGL